jgi:N12 class adenine-specific DNA methylase
MGIISRLQRFTITTRLQLFYHLPRKITAMTTLRQFKMDDLLKFNNVNLDVLTETYNMSFYMSYMSRWPESFVGKKANRIRFSMRCHSKMAIARCIQQRNFCCCSSLKVGHLLRCLRCLHNISKLSQRNSSFYYSC